MSEVDHEEVTSTQSKEDSPILKRRSLQLDAIIDDLNQYMSTDAEKSDDQAEEVEDKDGDLAIKGDTEDKKAEKGALELNNNEEKELLEKAEDESKIVQPVDKSDFPEKEAELPLSEEKDENTDKTEHTSKDKEEKHFDEPNSEEDKHSIEDAADIEEESLKQEDVVTPVVNDEISNKDESESHIEANVSEPEIAEVQDNEKEATADINSEEHELSGDSKIDNETSDGILQEEEPKSSVINSSETKAEEKEEPENVEIDESQEEQVDVSVNEDFKESKPEIEDVAVEEEKKEEQTVEDTENELKPEEDEEIKSEVDVEDSIHEEKENDDEEKEGSISLVDSEFEVKNDDINEEQQKDVTETEEPISEEKEEEFIKDPESKESVANEDDQSEEAIISEEKDLHDKSVNEEQGAEATEDSLEKGPLSYAEEEPKLEIIEDLEAVQDKTDAAAEDISETTKKDTVDDSEEKEAEVEAIANIVPVDEENNTESKEPIVEEETSNNEKALADSSEEEHELSDIETEDDKFVDSVSCCATKDGEHTCEHGKHKEEDNQSENDDLDDDIEALLANLDGLDLDNDDLANDLLDEFEPATKDIGVVKKYKFKICTSLASMDRHMVSRTNKLITILLAQEDISEEMLELCDIGTDENYKKIWYRKALDKDTREPLSLPGIFRENGEGNDDIFIGNYEMIHVYNEQFTVEEHLWPELQNKPEDKEEEESNNILMRLLGKKL